MNSETWLVIALIVTSLACCGLAIYIIHVLRQIIHHQAETIELLVMGPDDDNDDEDDPELRPLVPSTPRNVHPLPRN